jgi:hypothetical protein
MIITRMKLLVTFTLFLQAFALSIFAQNSLDDLNVIFKHDFENNTLGDYDHDEWNRDFLYPDWNNRQTETDIVQNSSDPINASKSLQINFPANSLGSNEGGTYWWTMIEKQNELYMSYDLYFMPGFEYQLGGKLPSLQGGELSDAGGSTGYDGFTGGLMFKQDGQIVFYIYYPDSKEQQYGESFTWGANNYPDGYFSPSSVKIEYGSGNISYCHPGEWHNITYRMVLNTVKPTGGGNYDGILEAFFDGKMVTQISHILFRHTTNLNIDRLRIMSFFGGGTDDWRNPIEEWLRIDNVILYTFKENIDVPRGNTLSPTNRTINYWRKFLSENSEPPAAPSSLTTNGITNTSITLRWTDNSSNEYGFKIYRSTSASSGFTEIGSTTANATSYTDATLQAGSTYYYRVRAYNDIGYSDYTPVLTASTTAGQVPAAPSNLESTSVGYTSASLSWSDLSYNEAGFQIERSGPDDFNIKNSFTVGTNISNFTDASLQMSSSYQYRVRSYNTNGVSAFSNTVEIKTKYITPPTAPSKLKSTDITDKSITVTWDDNSDNESGFIITRTLATDPSTTAIIKVGANDTSFTDIELSPSTTYVYTVKAVNNAGNSASSNKDVVSTLSHAETQRIKDGLVAYYNFSYDPDYIIHDQSNYGDPVNLQIMKPSAVTWNDKRNLDILSNTLLISSTPAKKIISAIKKTGELTVECWIKPFEPDVTTGSRIISLGNSDSELGFALDQDFINAIDNNSLFYSFRLQTESTNESGFPEIKPESGINYINMQHVAYVRDSLGRESLYLNGHKTVEGFRPSNFGTWQEDFYLRLGNESDMNHAWHGTFYSVAIYNRALSQVEVNKNYSVGPCDSLINDGMDYQVDVYPNPLTEFATVEIAPVEYQDLVPQAILRITDIYGNIQYQEILFNPNNQYIKTLSFKGYTKGIYFLQVISGNRQKSTKLIIQ